MKRPALEPIDEQALLCALVLVPKSFSRNRFFDLFQQPSAVRARRRAGRLRTLLRQLCLDGPLAARVIGERVLADGQVFLKYEIPALSYTRTSALTALEAATLRFALQRAGKGAVGAEDQRLVREALARLGPLSPPQSELER